MSEPRIVRDAEQFLRDVTDGPWTIWISDLVAEVRRLEAERDQQHSIACDHAGDALHWKIRANKAEPPEALKVRAEQLIADCEKAATLFRQYPVNGKADAADTQDNASLREAGAEPPIESADLRMRAAKWLAHCAEDGHLTHRFAPVQLVRDLFARVVELESARYETRRKATGDPAPPVAEPDFPNTFTPRQWRSPDHPKQRS